MSAQVSPANTAGTAKPAFGLTTVLGRVEDVQRYEGTYRTRIITPAADEYSSPQRLLIRSKTLLGSKEETITVTCRVGGYQRKPYFVTDKETGEVTKVIPVDMTLDHVE